MASEVHVPRAVMPELFAHIVPLPSVEENVVDNSTVDEWESYNNLTTLTFFKCYGDTTCKGGMLAAFGDANGVILIHCIVAVLLCLVNVILESFVIHLLNIVKRNRGESMGLILSFQLCVTECAICIFSVIALLLGTIASPRSPIWAKTSKYMVTFITTLLSTVVYILKLFVAFNEVLKVWINVRYENFWSQKKTYILLKCIWGMGVLLFVGVSVGSELGYITLHDVYKWAISAGNFLYLLFALISNTYLLVKLSKSRSNPYSMASSRSSQSSTDEEFWKVFFKSQFAVPIIISSMFVLFLMAATLDMFVGVGSSIGVNTNFLAFLLYNLMVLVDALIYMFFEPQIRNILRLRLRNWTEQRSVRAENRKSKMKKREKNAKKVEAGTDPVFVVCDDGANMKQGEPHVNDGMDFDETVFVVCDDGSNMKRRASQCVKKTTGVHGDGVHGDPVFFVCDDASNMSNMKRRLSNCKNQNLPQ